jgi:hypothetical protein
VKKEKWEVKRQVAYYQPGNLLEDISVEDRMIAFISSVWFRGVSVKDQIDKFSKNGKKDSEVWKRL